MEEDGLKRCKTCGRLLPFSMFTRAKSCSEGLNPQCKDCVREYSKKKYYSVNSNLAFDKMPWPFDNDSDEMDMQAIADYKKEKQLQR